MSKGTKPAVLFVCVKNGGKSQMAAALMRQTTGETVDVYSAGTNPGAEINALSAASLAEVGVDISDEKPKRSTPTCCAWISSSPLAAKRRSTLFLGAARELGYR